MVVPLITLLYCLVNISYNVVLTPEQFATSNELVVDFGFQILGKFGENLMLTIYIMSVFGMGISTLLSGSRLTMAASRSEESDLSEMEILKKLHSKNWGSEG